MVALNEEDFPDADKAKGKNFNRRFLDLAVWLTAWDRYSLGAALLKQMSFVDAQHHKSVVVEVRFVYLCLLAILCLCHSCRLRPQQRARGWGHCSA